MMTWLRWGVTGIALLNLVALTSLAVAYGWHCSLKPKFARRQASHRAFERLLAHSTPETES